MPAHKPRRDIHTEIAHQIIDMLENGQGLAGCPWYRDGAITRPVNVATKKRYNGVNILALWARADKAGYRSGAWGTYRQWASCGAQVRRSETGTHIVFYKPLERTNDTGETERFLFARSTTVFNAEQVDDYESPAMPASTMTPIERVDSLVRATQATITHGGDQAYYCTKTRSKCRTSSALPTPKATTRC